MSVVLKNKSPSSNEVVGLVAPILYLTAKVFTSVILSAVVTTELILVATLDIALVATVPSSISAKVWTSEDIPATVEILFVGDISPATVVISDEIAATVVTSVAFGTNLWKV